MMIGDILNIALNVFVSCALVLSSAPASLILSTTSNNVAYASTLSVSTADEFLSALENAVAGDVIDLGGKSIQIGAQTEGNDPIVNHANITIQNGSLSLRPAGIVQGADLTLKDLELTFQNSVRNGIFANGYNLSLENVKKSDTSAYSIHVVMGPIINPKSTYIPTKCSTNSPKLTIKGENSLGKIFMGVLDDIADDAGTVGFYDTYHPIITIDTACKSVFADENTGAVYACGVSEVSATSIMDLEKTGDEMIPNADRYRINSTTAAINLGGSQVKSIYGNTGTGKKITVNYYGGEYLTENVVLDSVGEVNVKTGTFKIASNTLSSNPILTGSSTALGVSSGATLIAGALGDARVYNFNGGGTLALGEGATPTQTLTFTGAVTGTTDVVFGNSAGFWKTAISDTVYIKAAKSYSNSFTVNTATCVPSGNTWNRNEDGDWSFVTDPTKHVHTYGYVPIDDSEHAYECTDEKCPDEDKGRIATEEHYFDTDGVTCDACGYEKTEIHDIFVAKDTSKLEQFKARVFNALIKKQTSIDVSDIAIFPDEVTYSATTSTLTGCMALAGIVREHPLFSTLCVGWSGFSFQTENAKIKSVDVTYNDLTWMIEDLRKFIKAYDDCMSRVSQTATEFQKATIIHDWVCEHVTYSLGADKADFALGAIYNGKAVCGGYSQSYQFLCQQAGLECNYVAGTTKSGVHAWNKVKVGGQWFFVDTTWDRGLATSKTFSHTYFLCNDDEFAKAGDGAHASDTKVTGNTPTNTEWYFKNKFWDDQTGVLSSDLLSQDPKLTQITNTPETPDCHGSHTWSSWKILKVATCENDGSKTRTCTVCKMSETQSIKATGHKWNTGIITKASTRTAFGVKTYTCTVCAKTKTEQLTKLNAITMLRLYNPYTGEHFYTSDVNEKNNLVSIGWRSEGVGWYAPSTSSTPVYRLYNSYVEGGDHHYTTSKEECDSLKNSGWQFEGVGWYSEDSKEVPLYRQYNPYAKTGTHNYTTSKAENNNLKQEGWREEGIAWYGIA